MLLWGGLGAFGVFPPAVVPSPGEAAKAFADEVRSGRLARDVVASLFRVTGGFGLAVLLGIPAGLWLGCSELARRAFLPYVNFCRCLSPLAWIPFAILWFGIGDAPAIFLIFLAAFFPLTLATISAVATIPSIYFQVAAEFGLTGGRRWRLIVLPAIAPQVITALRVTGGLSWLVVVAAEMLAGRDGLGFAVWDARNGLRMDLLVATMMVIGTIGVAMDRLLAKLTRIPSVRWGYER